MTNFSICFLQIVILLLNMFSSNQLIEVLQVNSLINSNIIRKTLLDITLNGQTYLGVSSLLYETCIVFKIKSQKQITNIHIKFSLQLLFEVVFVETNDQVKKQISFIKLEREGVFLIIKSQNCEKQLNIWREFLQKTLNQRGFHQLFKPIKKIGRGSFASVYLVQKNQNNKKHAVKAFSKQCVYSQEKGKQSLVNEIEILRKFNHKNLMKLYGVYQTDNSIYLVIELLQGGQLIQRLRKDHRKTSLQVKIMMKGLLEGLEVMHKKGIMHRDLKPQNILFRRQNDWDCVIADFGLAQFQSSEEYLFVRCGTPGFVAPEIVNIKDKTTKYTCACDMFSVGVIFHMLLLKKSPFPGIQFNDILRQNRACNFNFQLPEYKQISETSFDLLKRLLEINPLKRITASQALKHQFFQNQFSFWQSNRRSHLLKIEPRLLKENCTNNTSQELQNSHLKAKNSIRLPAIREDSCLKFKMKENVMNGKTQQLQSSNIDKQSPLLAKRLDKIGCTESRFRKQTHQTIQT